MIKSIVIMVSMLSLQSKSVETIVSLESGDKLQFDLCSAKIPRPLQVGETGEGGQESESEPDCMNDFNCFSELL